MLYFPKDVATSRARPFTSKKLLDDYFVRSYLLNRFARLYRTNRNKIGNFTALKCLKSIGIAMEVQNMFTYALYKIKKGCTRRFIMWSRQDNV